MKEIFKYTQCYQIITAFCFGGDTVHIQSCSFNDVEAAVNFLETDKARSEKWKSEGNTIYQVQINTVNVYSTDSVLVLPVSEADLRSHAEEKKGRVS
jgi:dienelactone hydrolase